ncbi:hypothetical protein AB5I41_13025 [Sphingomonas sp. MMS24-JH45]
MWLPGHVLVTPDVIRHPRRRVLKAGAAAAWPKAPRHPGLDPGCRLRVPDGFGSTGKVDAGIKSA